MSIGRRIAQARERKRMTMEELAKLCNTTRQTIFKYENDIVTNIPYDRILLLAHALDTTPAYLFGWVEDKTPDELTLTEGEKDLLALFRLIPEEQQPVVLAMIKAALVRK